ncbi:Sensory histidine kinase/phosphatase NtrB, partial [Frankliniella fusca]
YTVGLTISATPHVQTSILILQNQGRNLLITTLPQVLSHFSIKVGYWLLIFDKINYFGVDFKAEVENTH